MNNSEQVLIELLKGPSELAEPDNLTSIEIAHLYINSARLISVMGFLEEQIWLNTEKGETEIPYSEFLRPYFSNNFSSLTFLENFLTEEGPDCLKRIKKRLKNIEQKVLSHISKRSLIDQKNFMIQSLNEMKELFITEEHDQEGRAQSLGHEGLRLYRTFDDLDKIFELDYQLDRDMKIDSDFPERLYQGAGVGVQSGYSTIILALNEVDPKPGSRIIDLGSGYGRVGLVSALLRPDVNFIGYEYVPHRVEISNKAVEFFGLGESLNFETQDLSLESFKIPDAEVYYLYDPFTKETYEYVLKQIVEVSKRMKVTVVTKGNARNWLEEVSTENLWTEPIYIDEGNLCVFRSTY